MTDTYYDNSTPGERFTTGETARGTDVDAKFDDVQAAFNLVETDMGETLRVPDASVAAITENAAARANKILSFDVSGNPVATLADSLAADAAASAAAAATSASNAATSESNAATSESNASTSASNAATSESNAATIAAGLKGTSTSPVTVASSGTITLTTQTGKQFTAGHNVKIVRQADPTVYVAGVVTSYSGTTLQFTADASAGSGSHSDWDVLISGYQGAQGIQGIPGVAVLYYLSVSAGGTTLGTSQANTLVECSGASYTLAFDAVATLGNGWYALIQNIGTGDITLDPNGAETIDGVSTYTLGPNAYVLVQCDGSVLRTGLTGLLTKRLSIFSTEAAGATGLGTGDELVSVNSDSGLSNASQPIWDANNSLFIAGPVGSDTDVATSPGDGVWTLRATTVAGALRVAAGTAGLVGVKNNSTSTITSSNGTSWSAATALPAASKVNDYAPVAVGARIFVLSGTASTAYYTDDYATTWNTATLPAAAGNMDPVACNGLFAYWATGTTYYTSATGETGSWTPRTAPVTPTSSGFIRAADGNLWCWTTTGNYHYSTNGVDWTDSGVAYDSSARVVGFINGVLFFADATYGACFTVHNGVQIPRAPIAASGSADVAWAFDGTSKIVFSGTGSAMHLISDPTSTFEGK